jgi:hypothetical protein
MNLKKLIFGETSIKRTFKYYWLLFIFKTIKAKDKIRKPIRLTESESTATSIFIKILMDKGSKLYYDLETSECYIRSEDSTLFIFLESHNVKIINSVYGYDVNITYDLETFLVDRFRREMAVRRRAFKKEALSKVEHSLETTLNKLNKANNE